MAKLSEDMMTGLEEKFKAEMTKFKGEIEAEMVVCFLSYGFSAESGAADVPVTMTKNEEVTWIESERCS